MANDVLAHVGDTDGNVVAKSEAKEPGEQSQSQVGTVGVPIPGAITRIDEQVVALNRRLDDVLEMMLPNPERQLRDTLAELEHENKNLTISLYIMAGLFFLMLLARR